MLIILLRPELERECVGSETCEGVWFAGSYGECSASCDGGTYRRKVFCVEAGEPVAPDRCDEALKPFEESACNEQVRN